MNKTKNTAGWLVMAAARTKTMGATLAMAAALAMGMTACTNDDNITDEPQPAGPKTYTLTIEASKGDGGTTRALSLSADGMTLTPVWKTGETVSVSNETYGRQADLGTLTAQSDGASTTLTGTLTGTIVEGDELYLSIVRDGDYDTQQGTLEYISNHLDIAVCIVHVASVDASNNITLTEGTADFDNAMAVVRFHLMDKAGTPLNASALNINIPAVNYWEPSDYPLTGMTDATYTANAYGENTGAGVVYAAIGGFTDTRTVTLTATVGTDTYTYSKSGVTFQDGKFYDITVKMTKHEPALGDLYYSDGTYSTTLVAGKTPIGVIAYLDQTGTDDDEITESGNGGGHGLVLCLKNAASYLSWSTNISSQAYTGNAYVTDAAGLTRLTGASGYNATNAMASVENAATVYPAAYQAKNYTGLAAPATGTTGWFLPSAQQWVKMQQALGGMDGSTSDKTIQDLGNWFDNAINGCTAWETALAKAGSGNYDSMTPYLYYFSSSEHSEQYTILLKMDGRKTGNAYGFCWCQFSKTQQDDKSRVRPALAF